MDDGSGQKGSYKLATCDFSYKGNMILKRELHKFNIPCKILKQSNYYIIRIPVGTQFSNLIKPYIIPSMMYKIQTE